MRKNTKKRIRLIIFGILAILVLLFLNFNNTTTNLIKIGGRMVKIANSDDTTMDKISYNIIDKDNKYVEVSGYTGTAESLIIDETVTIQNEKYTVKNIGNGAFRNSALKNIEIPSGVISIGYNAFSECSSLISIKLSNDVISIGSNTFYGCSSLKSIEIPNSVTSIRGGAFNRCSSLTSIKIPNKVTSIDTYTFYGCSSLTNIEIPNSVTSIGGGAFEGCSSLKSIEMPNNLTSIGSSAFRGCSSLTSFKIPNNVTSIERNTFYGCSSLISIELPKNLKNIGDNAFWGCSSLTSVEIPEEVTSIGYFIFNGCSKLELIRVPSTIVVPENITDNPKTVIGYVYNNIAYKINEDGETVSALDSGEQELPETVIINNKTYKVVAKEISSIAVTGVVLNGNQIVNVGGKISLICSIQPDNATNKNITWTSSDESVATVDENGVVTGVSNGTAEITVTTEDGEHTATKTITVKKLITGIKVTKIPDKVSYVKGEALNIEGIEITATYEDGTTGLIELSEDKFTGYDANKLGEQTITVTYAEGITDTFKVNVHNNITKIEVTKEPTKVSYVKGEYLNIEGVEITATYEDGTTELIELSEDKFTGYDANKLGKQTITVTYEGKTTTFEVTVIEMLYVEVKNYEEVEESGTKYIEKILPNTSIEALKRNLETNGTVEIYKNKEKITDNSSLIGTGMEIVVKLNNEERRYTVVVTGDLIGNGKMGIGDLSKLARYAAKIDTDLKGAYLRASDIVKDGKYGRISDISKMARVLAGMDNL